MKAHRRILALAISLVMLAVMFSACEATPSPSASQPASQAPSAPASTAPETATPEPQAGATKPEKITFMVDGTFLIKENGEDVLVKGYEDLFGVDLELNHPVHNEYYEKVNLAFTTNSIPDALLLSSSYYLNYANNGALYDITDLYENSAVKDKVFNQAIIDSLRIDGRLYGLPRERGNGTVTYVRGDWMEKLGLSAPTNYDEFINMLRKFKFENPDGLTPDQVYPITSAGLVNNEFPFDIYLREFYWTATPDFVERDGKWVDGMTEDVMKDALQRMRDAYAEGLIDPEIITNKTSTCRDKFYAGNVGVFNYWAGMWNKTLSDNLTANFPDATVVPIKPIKETYYIERPPVPIAITAASQNPEGVFEYFLSTMLDEGEGQKLWTFGVKGEAGTATYTEDASGKISFLPSIEDPSKNFTKAFSSPELSITGFKPNFEMDEKITSSLQLFNETSVVYNLMPASEAMSTLGPELNAIKAATIANIVYGETTIEDGLANYQSEAQGMVDSILAEMNK